MWHETVLARLCGLPAQAPDQAVVDALDECRLAAVWIWSRLTSDGRDGHPLLVDAARALAAAEALRARWLQGVLDAIQAEGVPVLIVKGAGLSYRFYPEPWLRSRNDDDLLVRRQDFDRASAALRRCGYDLMAQNPGAEETGQAHFSRAFPGAGAHHVDLHWRVCVPAAFTGLPGFEALEGGAVPLPALGSAARGLGPVHALVVGCAHRVAHHALGGDPMWLADAHVLSRALDEEGWRRFCQAALAARVGCVCRFELSRAVEWLGTVVPDEVLCTLASAPVEASARHLDVRGRLERWLLDLADHPDGPWRAFRVRALPTPTYMRARYGVATPMLPAAYLWRGVAGGGQWILEAARRRIERQ
jgi:hypothetical protein